MNISIVRPGTRNIVPGLALVASREYTSIEQAAELYQRYGELYLIAKSRDERQYARVIRDTIEYLCTRDQCHQQEANALRYL